MTSIQTLDASHDVAGRMDRRPGSVTAAEDFRASLAVARRARDATTAPEDLREAARDLVAAGFVAPILAELRSSTMAAPPFGPGAFERRLGPMLDAQVASRIVEAQGLPLVDAVLRQITRSEGPGLEERA